MSPSSKKLAQRQRRGIVTMIVFMFVAVAIVAGGLFGPSLFLKEPGANASTSESNSETKKDAKKDSKSDESCPTEFVQEAARTDGGPQVDPGFEAAILAAIATATDENEALRDTVLERAAISGQRLAIAAHYFGIVKDEKNWQPYVKDGCLSELGQKLYDKLDIAVHMPGVTFAIGEAPASGTNSGMKADGTYGIDANPGIGGNRKAVEITLADGSKGWFMFRCGNPVYQSPPPGLPHVPTDNPPPPPPAPTCPWNPALPPESPNCLEPKPSDASEWEYDDEKGTVDETGAATDAADVDTEATGGGGVVDTATSTPGSETGGAAPGAGAADPGRGGQLPANEGTDTTTGTPAPAGDSGGF